jgi:ABC-2 type transport system permease protein
VKKTIRISKIELATLFYSPIAWLLLIVFFVQCGMMYSEYMQGWVTMQELGGDYKEQLQFLTAQIFAFPAGMTNPITGNLYLYLPLLTMGLISREISSGTIKLLYSSPVKIKHIIFGKFLAICAYCLLLTLVFGMYLAAGTFHLENADKGLMLAILLGVFLLLCAYGAIGLFVSCLTSYQVVAAISTFVLFAFLNYLGNLWQDIDFVRDVTYSLSLSGRIGNMAGGLITTKDLCYFGVVMFIFLGLSILKLNAGRSTDSGLLKTLKYAGVVLFALVIGYFTSRPTFIGYFDATETKTRTLTKASQQILKDLGDEPLEITTYVNLVDNYVWYGVPSQRNTDLERWMPYMRFKPNITLKYVYYYDSVPNPYFFKQYPGKTLDQIAANHAKSMNLDIDLFKKPNEIRKIINLRPEDYRYVMQLKYKNKSTFLRLYDDALVFPTERETSAALKRLIVQLPKVAFLEGELERSATRSGDKDYKRMTSEISFRYALINQGFDFTTVSLKNGDIPADISVLVIADPKAPFEPVVLEKIQRYIDDGGNVLIAGEPGKQSVLNPLLQHFGVRMMEGMVVQKSEDFSPNLALNFLTDTAAALSKMLSKDFRDSTRISMPSATGFLCDENGKFDIKPLLMTDERTAWLKKAPLSSDSVKVSFAEAEGDEKLKMATMLGLTRQLPNGKQQRIVLSADADFISSSELNRYQPITANFRLNTVLFGWLSNGQFPVDVTRPEAKDKVIFLKGTDIFWLKVVFIWVVPFIIFILGTILLVRRKKQ